MNIWVKNYVIAWHFLIEEATGTGLQSGREAQWQQARGWIVCLIFYISSSSSHFDKWSRVVELIDAFLNGRLLFNFSLLPLAPASVLLYLIFLYNFVESRTRKQCFNTWHLFYFSCIHLYVDILHESLDSQQTLLVWFDLTLDLVFVVVGWEYSVFRGELHYTTAHMRNVGN